MSTAFEGPRRKLERARLHIESFCFHERRFFNSGAYVVVGEREPGTNSHFFKLAIKEPLPAESFAAIVGDALHNLRSALDHLAWQIAEDFEGPNPRDTRTQFPAFLTQAEFDSVRANQRRARIGPNAQSRMRALQPFVLSPGKEVVNTLWLISDLDNHDKHRNLAVAGATMRGYDGKLFHSANDTGTYSLTINQEDLADGDPIGQLVIDPPDVYVEVEAVFDFGIVLTAPSVPDTRPRVFVNRFLHRAASWVEAVLDAFEPFYVSGSYDDDAALPPLSSYHWAPPPPDEARPWMSFSEPDEVAAKLNERAAERLGEALGKEAEDPAAARHANAGFRVGVEAGYGTGHSRCPAHSGTSEFPPATRRG